MLNITTNHAITYTNIILPCVCSVMDQNDIQLNLPWVTTWNTKQLLDEVEHDIMNYQNRGSVLSAEA